MNRQTGQSLPHLPQLDGLRALAILLVLLHHSFGNWPALFPASFVSRVAKFGWAGVDVFFVLSGFLITKILLAKEPSVKSLKNFYTKRVLRIWPLYYGLLAITLLLFALMHKSYPLLQSLVFVQNFLPYFPKPGFFNQTWSLCVEEHFYLVWPFVVFFVRREALPWILVIVVIVSPLLRLYALNQGVSDKLLYMSTQFRLDGIALGSLLALLIEVRSFQKILTSKIGIMVVASGLLGTVWLLSSLPENDFGFHSAWVYSFIAFASLGLLLWAFSSDERSSLYRLLTLTPLQYTGKISYGLYMIHPFFFSALHPRIHGWAGPVTATALSFLCASLSWTYVEKPILRLKRHLTDDQTRNSEEAGAQIDTLLDAGAQAGAVR